MCPAERRQECAAQDGHDQQRGNLALVNAGAIQCEREDVWPANGSKQSQLRRRTTMASFPYLPSEKIATKSSTTIVPEKMKRVRPGQGFSLSN